MRPRLFMLALTALAACTQFPDLDAAVAPDVANAPYPRLLPIEEVLGPDRPPRATPEAAERLSLQAAALQARARTATGSEAAALSARADALRLRAGALRAE
ncbi:hypothetical protein [Rhodosalinus sp. FB01]|uniref:hypothetical protein n=1 Tax=Rhodosalinus sp. FB01 TaxID=3239194 RepID=UPI003526625D